jgi:rhamnogalacturonan endolyase
MRGSHKPFSGFFPTLACFVILLVGCSKRNSLVESHEPESIKNSATGKEPSGTVAGNPLPNRSSGKPVGVYDAANKPTGPKRPMEFLNRALVALEQKEGVFLSWRMLGTDPPDIGFNLYRNGVKITPLPVTSSTNFVDKDGKKADKYAVEPLQGHDAGTRSGNVAVWPLVAPSHPGAIDKKKPWVAYKEIPLSDNPENHYPGDMGVGDLDGDGQYELVFVWEGQPSFLEAIDLDGNRLWRISCGPNISHNKLALLVYDFDGDGKAEVSCQTAPGTKDGTGKYLSKGPAATDDDTVILERKSGRLVEGPAYITIFNGMTGEELATTLYWPQIGPKSEMVETWGDGYGHRASSLKAAVLHHKDLGPLLVYSRGIYSRIAMAAHRWDGKTLERVWTFDTKGNPEYESYRGMGNHSLAVGDVDYDGSDELIYGACAIDHDGKGLYTTGRGHGDSHALADHIPDLPGLEFYQGHENSTYGLSMRDAATGKIIWEVLSKADVGRAWAENVHPGYRGSICTSSATPNFDCNGKEIETKYSAYHQPIYFGGGVQRELRNRTSVAGKVLTGWYYRADTIHSSKYDANLVADILGDWREEVIFKRNDDKAFLLFTTWIPTERKNYTLMHDPVYRMNVAVQAIGYNQPAHVGYYFPDGAPIPHIRMIHPEAGK